VNPTVLVFDDEDDLREVVCRMLQRRGFATLSAGHPAEAVVICQQHPGEIHLLLADLGMPGAIGVELARLARLERPGLPVLFISGMPKADAVRQGVLAEDVPLVQKPFTIDALITAVATIVSEHATRGYPARQGAATSS
jgi:CheY-like chemotaxis protein